MRLCDAADAADAAADAAASAAGAVFGGDRAAAARVRAVDAAALAAIVLPLSSALGTRQDAATAPP